MADGGWETTSVLSHPLLFFGARLFRTGAAPRPVEFRTEDDDAESIMAIVSSVPGGNGEAAFYEVPDQELQKYALRTDQLTDEKKSELFSGKEVWSRDDAEGVMPAAVMGAGGDVQAYGSDICWIRVGTTLYWWYC